MPDIHIRIITNEDIDAIIELTAKEFKAASIDATIESMLGGVPWTRVKAAALRGEIQQNPEGCFVATADGCVVGYVTTVINSIASRGTIANLVVSSACQGKGFGRKLIRHAIEYFRREGLHHAKIETLATNEAGQHLYPAMGFREVAHQIHYAMPLA